MAKKVRTKPNKKVRGASKKIYDGIEFDSALEVNCYKLLKEANIKFEYGTKTYELMPKFRLNNVSSYDFSKAKGYGQTLTKAGLKRMYSNMTLTPDFIIDSGGRDISIIIETKGFANDVYPYKKKMLFLKHEEQEKKLYYFEPRNIAQIKTSINEIKQILND